MKFRSAVCPAILLQAILFTVKPCSLSAQCNGIYLVSYSVSPIVFSTYDQLMAGGTALQYITAQINLTTGGINCPSWSLTVKASGNFSNGSNSVPLNYTAVRFNTVNGGPSGGDIGISPNPFPLSTSEVTIIDHSREPISSASTYTFEIKYDLMIQGGSHLLVPTNGDYQTNLSFYLYAQNGQLISTASTNAKFQIYYAPNTNSTLQLQNGANNISLNFNSAADILNGVSDTKTDGMVVTAFYGHQVIVKASGSNLVAPGISYTIPVSVVNLLVTTNASQEGIVCYSVPLSTASQVVVSNPMSDYLYQNINYTLKYSIAGGNSYVSRGPPGVYTANIVFAIVPL
jgi:hypothetical protein